MVELSVYVREAVEAARAAGAALSNAALVRLDVGPSKMFREERAQGTTEYAILVGVLVVIAILAIVAFRENLTKLWDAISSGINSL